MKSFPIKTRSNAIKQAVKLGFILSLAYPLSALGSTLQGHFKGAGFWQLWPENTYPDPGSDQTDLLMADVRLKWQKDFQAWHFDIDYQLQGVKSQTLLAKRSLVSEYNAFDLDQTQLFNLTDNLVNEDDKFVYQRLDRLNATYRTADYAIKAGRQAITWGNGVLFNPLDRFNPFAPNQYDREYKPGIDMLSWQKLLIDGDELSGVVIPRRNLNGEIDASSSGLGFKLYHYGETVDSQWILSQDRNETLTALQLTGNWLDGVWNLDWMAGFDHESKDWTLSSVANYQSAFSWFNRNFTYAIEYFYNGYGSHQSRPYLQSLDKVLLEKLNSGQLFTLNRHYADLTLNAELTPLFNLSASAIFNLQDGSSLWNLNGQYSLSDQSQLLGGWQYACGESGTEFGGLQLSSLSNKVSAYPQQLYLQYQYYF
ncbi:hypothetical protein [Thiomicrorhabdus sp.]|uniref:hypothetical protein n=1 Tax=Thiomicrorhabdus sp. TaxID=2039724 RepID=UPI0029C7F7CC|nr:hypothetical protein [Thiomicrorhabdus sp.]